ncbi:MAG: hypothetical protein WKF70_02960 [Chitinophagaceae bacterium]
MQLPEELLSSLSKIDGFDKEAFIKVHQSGEQVTSIRSNPSKIANPSLPVLPQSEQTGDMLAGADLKHPDRVPWCRNGYYLHTRPSFTFDPLFHGGCYYVQEASSMFLEQALAQSLDLQQPLKVLDLCAAPGGKSTHLQSLLTPDSLLVSNELIKARAGILKQNIIKWGCGNVVVTTNEPFHFKKLEGFFDAIVVDAPCSGSGLFRKDERAIVEWSPQNVELCCGRQQRILTDILPSLKEGGVLIYSTCSYAQEENEDIADWLLSTGEVENIKLAVEEDWKLVQTRSGRHGAEGYRFYPHRLRGEGFFLCVFRKLSATKEAVIKPGKPNLLPARDREVVQPWTTAQTPLVFIKHDPFVFAWPEALVAPLLQIQMHLYIQYAGTALGAVMHNKLVPDHALALSTIRSKELRSFPLSFDEAIIYLQRGNLDRQTVVKGWQLVTYANQPLGWINALPNRINNYYPKELRILKRHNDSSFGK